MSGTTSSDTQLFLPISCDLGECLRRVCGGQQNSEGSAQARVTVVRVNWEKETGRFPTLEFCWEQPRIRGPRLWTRACFSLDLTKCLWETIKICFSYGGDLNIVPIPLDPKNTEKIWPSAHLKPEDILQSLTAKRRQLSKPYEHLFLFDAWVFAKCVWPTPWNDSDTDSSADRDYLAVGCYTSAPCCSKLSESCWKWSQLVLLTGCFLGTCVLPYISSAEMHKWSSFSFNRKEMVIGGFQEDSLISEFILPEVQNSPNLTFRTCCIAIFCWAFAEGWRAWGKLGIFLWFWADLIYVGRELFGLSK